MAQVPSNLIPISITQLPVSATTSEDVLLVGVYQGVTYKFRAGDLLQVAGVPTSRQVIAGTGLTGGGQLVANVTLSVAPGGIGTTQLATTGVTPGVYGNGTSVPQFTVDATGRVTAATTVPLLISGYVPDTRQVIAGNGLTGGGALSSNVTLSASYGGTPLAGSGSGSAGTALTLSRSDHRHPAVDLADQTQIDGILPIDQGGTGRSLVMQPGAIIWSGADGLYVGTAGVSGQVLVSGGTGAPTWGSTLILAPVAANTFFAGPTSGGVADPVFRTMVNADLPNSGVVAATYGSGTQVPVLVVNSKGVVTSASAVDVTPAWANITGTPTTIAGYGITDGVTLTGSQTLTNKTIDASLNTLSNIPNAALSFSSVTINGSSVSLGGSITVTATATAALTIGTGLSGTSYNGSTAVTIAIDSTVATLSGLQTLTNKTISGANNTLSNIGNSSLTNSSVTFNGVTVALGASGTITAASPNALTAGSYLTSTGTYDGSVARTFAVDATDANTASKVVARDASGNFSAGTITASLSGNASTATSATTSTNLAGGTTGSLPYQSASGTTAMLALGTTNYVLTAGAAGPQYVAQSTLTAGKATNLDGGAASQIPYQTGAGATGFIANGTAGQVLTSAGAGAPTWSGISGGTF